MATASRPKVADLFCGCGGLSCGFRWAGFEPILGADISHVYLRTYQRNFPSARIVHADLSNLAPSALRLELGLQRGELDCLVGGPPCQGFSKNVPAAQRCLDDPRNRLIATFLAYVDELLPKVVLLENVAEMVRAYDGAVTRAITRTLVSLGYSVDVRVLTAADYGVPQVRRRAFFFANRLQRRVSFPEVTHSSNHGIPKLFGEMRPYVTVWEAIGDLPSMDAGHGESPVPYPSEPRSEYQRLVRNGTELLHDHVARPLRPRQLARVRALKEGEGTADLPPELQPEKGYSGAYARLHSQGVARTITKWVFHPGSGRFSHPYDDRVITIREAARLQGFPDWFVFEGSYVQKANQVGEAVPPLLARALGEIARHLILGVEKSHDGVDEVVRVHTGRHE